MQSYVLNSSDKNFDILEKNKIIQPLGGEDFDEGKKENGHPYRTNACKKYENLQMGDTVYIKKKNAIVMRGIINSNFNKVNKSYTVDNGQYPDHAEQLFQRDPEKIERTQKKTDRGLGFCKPSKYLKKGEKSFETRIDSVNSAGTPKNAKKFITSTETYYRSQLVRDTVIHSADGICKLCKRRIHNVNFDTFNVKDHIPELQCHHIIPLSGGGQDSVQNCEALCPDCHRRKHLRNDINNPLE